VDIRAFQRQIELLYGERDRPRGIDRSFVWFTEEVGELAKEIRREPRREDLLRLELSDVLAWLVTLASQLGIDMAEAADRYAQGCPKCGATPCACP
jgi:NTP pyrophosphatase (non-canonical NTP hydrolase)